MIELIREIQDSEPGGLYLQSRIFSMEDHLDFVSTNQLTTLWHFTLGWLVETKFLVCPTLIVSKKGTQS